MTGLIGKKLGMTRVIQDDGRVIPMTVIQCEPNIVAQIKTVEKDGYPALVLGFSQLNKPTKTRKFHVLKEFRVKGDEQVQKGDTITVEMFKEGDLVSVTGTSKGKGFQGVVKRHHMAHTSTVNQVQSAHAQNLVKFSAVSVWQVTWVMKPSQCEHL